MFPIVPVGIAGLVAAAYWRRRKNRGVMTPDRLKIFNAAISGGVKQPEKLDQLANTFAGEGLYAQATLLRQRARLKRLPKDVREARRAVFRRAIQSKNKAAILKLAGVFDSEGCTGAAMRLREVASGLPNEIPEPVTEPTPEPVPESADSESSESADEIPPEIADDSQPID